MSNLDTIGATAMAVLTPQHWQGYSNWGLTQSAWGLTQSANVFIGEPTGRFWVSYQTRTEQAMVAFLQNVQNIVGVTLRIIGGETIGEQAVVVTVPSLWSEVADQVFDLLSAVHRAYPGARLDVYVHGIE